LFKKVVDKLYIGVMDH